MGYDELVKAIHDAPGTFLPGLLIEVMKAGYGQLEWTPWRKGRCHKWLESQENLFLNEGRKS